MVVVLAAVLLEVRREVEQGLGQCVSQHEHERDHQATDPAVAVEERMDHLELVVGDRELDQERKVGLVQELLEVAECSLHFVGWWGDEDGVLEGGSTDPHGTGA